jgi:high-affinity iron transporter
LSALLFAVRVGPAAAQESDRDTLLRQVVGVLDYVAADYAGAVADDGTVRDQDEYEEQLSLAADAVALARRAGIGDHDPVMAGLRALDALLRDRRPGPEVLAACREVRDAVVRGHGLRLEPGAPPDRERGRALYASAGCVACHGERGDGRGPAAVATSMEPPPASFIDPERARGMSPNRAFYAISFGIAGTQMTRFDYLPATDRWSLAFYVTAMRHAPARVEAGRRLVEARGLRVERDHGVLSQRTDDELRAALPAELAEDDAEAVLAYLRGAAPFTNDGGGTNTSRFALARARLVEGLRAYGAGDRDGARRLFVSAYLDGVEPAEAALEARAPALVAPLERAMMRLRTLSAAGAATEDVAAAVAEAEELLARADSAPAEGGGGMSAFLASMAIALREGFEAALLIAALLGLVRKRGVPEHARWIHAGWVAAVGAGVVTWLAVGELVGGLARELAEGVVALVAAVVLLGVTHWIFGQASAQRFMSALSRNIGARLGRGAAWAAFGLAFIAAYREAFEIVLFYRALLLDAGSDAAGVLLGAGAGVAVLVALVLAFKQVGKKIPPRPFMLVSSGILAVLAVMLVGKGVRALQEAAVVPMTTLHVPDVPVLGLYGTAQTLAAQGVLAVLLVGSALWPWLRSRRPPEAARRTALEPRDAPAGADEPAS